MSAQAQDNASPPPPPFVDRLPGGPGVSRIDPSDPAAPLYQLLAKMRTPVTLRDLMIHPVRAGYIGQERPIDPKELPKSAAELTPRCAYSRSPFPRRPVASAAKSSARRPKPRRRRPARVP
jgi:acetyl esterase